MKHCTFLLFIVVLFTNCKKETDQKLNSAVNQSNSLVTQTWTIGGQTRTALVYQHSGTNLPIMFAFHGHGQTAEAFASNENFEASWPNAIIVYPQGLPTCNGAGGECDKSGWQHELGEINPTSGKTDQDLKFFDAMLASFHAVIDTTRVFVHGWSNGGEFAYDVLWQARPGKIAAICGASAIVNVIYNKHSMPIMHVAGDSDHTVPFTQQEAAIDSVRILNQCSANGNPWPSENPDPGSLKYTSPISCPVVNTIYQGGHAYPSTVPALITTFFKGL